MILLLQHRANCIKYAPISFQNEKNNGKATSMTLHYLRIRRLLLFPGAIQDNWWTARLQLMQDYSGVPFEIDQHNSENLTGNKLRVVRNVALVELQRSHFSMLSTLSGRINKGSKLQWLPMRKSGWFQEKIWIVPIFKKKGKRKKI